MKIDILLVIVGLLGGIINSIAGGGGILMYPTLLAAGLPAIIANATSSLVIWPGALTSAYGYRKYIKKVPRYYFILLIPALFGSIIGSLILVKTSNILFERIAPWLVVIAVFLLAIQPKIHDHLRKSINKSNSKHPVLVIGVVSILVFPLAIYGGYFGVGFGIMLLAFLGFTTLTNIHQMNGIKNLTGATIAIVSTLYFARAGLIDWHAGLFMLSGNAIGGAIGSHIAQKFNTKIIHRVMVFVGGIVAIVLLYRAYR